ncbi:TPA: subtilase, partial [Proteus mirabilis]
MVSKRKHLDVARFFIDEPFKSKRPGRNSGVPGRDRNQHGSYLAGLYQNLINAYEQKRKQQINPITDDSGIYVEIIGVDGCKLPLDSLDNRDFKLCSCQMRGDREFALIFIPEDKRDTFLKKIQQYLDPQKDGKPNKEGVSFPRNHTLIDSISEIRLANLESFWTDPIDLFPADRNLDVWWELWLKSNTV